MPSLNVAAARVVADELWGSTVPPPELSSVDDSDLLARATEWVYNYLCVSMNT